MKERNVTDRLTYLAEIFDVFESNTGEKIENKRKELEADGYSCKVIGTEGKFIKDTNTYAILSSKVNSKERVLKKVSVSSEVFTNMIIADPTENKMYVQWMLNLYAGLIKSDKKDGVASALRLVREDLPQAKEYLILFEGNKRKKKFSELCKGSYILKGISDPTDINQYKSLAQLFDAVDPFIEKEPSAVEKLLYKFVDAGQALIPVHDRKFTLYIPKTTDASVVFEKFANWCTAKAGNSMFKSYTTDNKKPNGKNSDIYIIVNNKFFTGESEELYQIHFETNQIKDRHNDHSNVSIFENVINKSDGLSNFFYEELMTMAKQNKRGVDKNCYLDALIKFGFAEALFDMLDERTPVIRFMNREIPKIPDLTRFKYLDMLVITDAKLVELHPSIGKMCNLDMLVLTNNNLRALPKEIGLLKKVTFINIVGNPIKEIPTDIKYLDRSNGGSLYRIGVKREEIGEENYQKLKELLPTTEM